MAVKNVTELDFSNIRQNLRLFLENQDEFSDYNFEASGMSVLLDLLHTTHTTMPFSHTWFLMKFFLDSAVRRNSVVSIAKTMGYTPRSARSAKSAINLTVVPSSSYVSTSLTLTKDKQFQSSVNGVTRNFVPDKDYVISKTVEDGVANF